MLDLEHLETFCVVTDTNNFTRAAARLGCCQSTVTMHIRALERELGAPLFVRDRSTKTVVLTEVGRRVLQYAGRLLALVKEAKSAVRDKCGPLDCSFAAKVEGFETMNVAYLRVIKLLLVDDDSMFREGLARMLANEEDLQVVGEVACAAEGLPFLNSGTDVVLLDANLGPDGALEFMERMQAAAFQGRILIVTAGISSREAIQLVEAGVAGIVHKNHPTQVLCRAIRNVAAGDAYLESEYLPALFQSVSSTGARNRPLFSERDRVVLRHVLQGLTNREIGDKIDASEGAVATSLWELFEKLGVDTRAQLVKVALEQYNGHL